MSRAVNPSPETKHLARLHRVDLVASALFHADVLEGRSTTTQSWETTPEHEKAAYLAEARATFRQLDATVTSVARHRAVQAAEATLPAGTLNVLGRQALKDAVKAALEAFQTHMQREDSAADLREFEKLAGIPTPPPVQLRGIDGGRL